MVVTKMATVETTPCLLCQTRPNYSLSPRENDGTEREAQGVGRDKSFPRKLFLIQRKSRFSGEFCFPRCPHAVLPRSQLLSDTSSAITWNFCFSFKHQTEVGLHADASEDRLPLKQRL